MDIINFPDSLDKIQKLFQHETDRLSTWQRDLEVQQKDLEEREGKVVSDRAELVAKNNAVLEQVEGLRQTREQVDTERRAAQALAAKANADIGETTQVRTQLVDKTEELKERELDLDVRATAYADLEKREEQLKAGERELELGKRSLEIEQQKVEAEKEELLALKVSLHKRRGVIRPRAA